jgi:hypothetical protein
MLKGIGCSANSASIAQARESERAGERAGGGIETTIAGELASAAVPFRSRKAFIETDGDSDDRSVRISNGDRAQADENAVDRSVTERRFKGGRLAVVQRRANRLGGVRQYVPVLVGLSRGILAAEATNDVVAQVARDFFGAFVPKQNSLIAVDKIDAGLKAFENDAKDFRGVEFGHAMAP